MNRSVSGQPQLARAVAIRRWEDADLPLLRALLADPAMTRYLGGPETEPQLRARHQRYLDLGEKGSMFVITVGEDRDPAGSVGYWENLDHGSMAWETGWGVLPAWQGRGIATTAMRLVLDEAAAEHRFRFVHAYPSVDNAPSNRVCEKLGFELLGADDFEYPKGHWMQCNNWRLALWPEG